MTFSKPQFRCARLVLLIFAQVLAPIAVVVAAQVEVEIVKDFVYYGNIQQAPLILADDGFLYGTAQGGGAFQGGPFNGGTIYRTDTNGNITVIHNFQCGVVTNGCSPAAGLIQLGDGFLYGTTYEGGANGQGTVFKVKPDGTNFTVIKSFSCTVATDACRSQTSLIQSTDGFLYGTTGPDSDSGSQGTVFKLKPDGTNFVVIKSFQCVEGCVPLAGLISLPDGFLYGTTSQGGATNSGTVFKLLPDGSNFSVIKSFQCNVAGDGCAPAARLIQLADGFLYGTTGAGGANGGGAVYKLKPDGTGFNVIKSLVCGFNIPNCDGGGPHAGLIQLSDGFLYGTTYQGGATNSGTVFKVKPEGTDFSVIKSFECNVIIDGCFPITELIHLSDGFLYGTALGGLTGSGIIFKVSPESTGFTLLASFGCVSSCSPAAGLIQASDGFLYGTTQAGGVGNGGSLFKVNPDGTGFSVIKSFNCIGSTGACSPLAGLIQLSDGFLYGTTAQGGVTGSGTVYKVKPDGTGFSVIKTFVCRVDIDGCSPRAGLIQLADGFLYGTTGGTGTGNDGTVFKLKPDGTSFSVIKSFHCGNADGCGPLAGLIQLSDGFLYGTTNFGNGDNLGTVFKLKPDGTGFSVIKAFQCGVATDGCRPFAGLIQLSDGFLYGTTQGGGATDGGTVFKVKPDGTGFSVIKSFQCGVGCHPVAGLIQLADGFLYGTTQNGGADNNGTLFKVRPDGNGFTVLNSFVFDGDDGIQPQAGLTLANNGYVYGTTFSGGAFGVGTIFRFVAPDTTAPDTSINAGPTGVIAVNSATFSWTGSDNVTVPANLVYAYRLDPIEPAFSAFGSATSQSYTGLTNGNYTFIVKAKDQDGNEDTTPATRTFAVSVPNSNPTIALTFGGQTADRVGPAEFALNADGKLDGVFSVTLNPGSGNRTITRLHLTNTPGGVWNTVGGDGFWSLGVATSTVSALLNASNDSVTFGVTEGDTFKIFAADYQNAMYLNGVVFTLTASFSDGSSTSASATISAAADTTPPDTSITSGPPNPSVVSSVAFSWTGSDNLTTADNLVYAYRLDPIEPNFSAFTSATTKSYTGLANGNYTFVVKAKDQAGNEDPTPASRAFTVNVPGSNPNVSLSFDGQRVDRVGQAEFALHADGKVDGVFTVTLNAGSGNRTITRLHLTNTPGGVWNTQGSDGFWSLGVATSLGSALLNASNDSVNFAVAEGSSFKIFAADYQNAMYLSGVVFTLTVNFDDGNSATASTMIAPPQARIETIKDFNGLANGSPLASLIQASDGFLYGTTLGGGAYGVGSVFRIRPDGSSFSVIKSFQCNVVTDGCHPQAGLIQLADGFLYGTTFRGGANDEGTVYRLQADGSGFSVIKSFQCHVVNNGCHPLAELIQLADGFLYGTTPNGGPFGLADGQGTVFKLRPDGSDFSVIKLFQCSVTTDACFPYAGLTSSTDGYLYGTTNRGGVYDGGTVFRLKPDGTDFTETRSFQCNVASDGCPLDVVLIQLADGFLYGTTQTGGAGNGGTVFKIKPNGSDFSVIKSFQCARPDDGCFPLAGLIQLADGFLYGTAAEGGKSGQGIVFKILPDGSSFSLVDSFSLDDGNGTNPGRGRGLRLANNGYVYGTTTAGGAFGGGTIFRFSTPPDTVSPGTNILEGPTGTVTLNGATFSWTGSDNVTTVDNLVYAYRLDPIEAVGVN